MKQLSQVNQIRTLLGSVRKEPATIGFVPTMGALHEGHLSLIRASMAANSFTLASIYVNPTQFNSTRDLKNYPRKLEQDCKMLDKAGCDLVFTPSDSEMYPEQDNRVFDFGHMGSVMEGKYRPGHFNGVAQIVSKLFDIVEPDIAYFGMKDFQQLAIIRKMVDDQNLPVKIVGCPIIREKDGLAMSSRNALLNTKQRKAAPLIYKTLLRVKEQFRNQSVSVIEDMVSSIINSDAELQLEYFQLVESDSLIPVITKIPANTSLTACIAVFAGQIRLIDNIGLIS
jgi:pantoate--beta-alanine ligase